MQGIAGRAHLVDAVKREVEAIHALDGKRQADLVAIAEGRAEIVQARGEMDRLLGSLAETREKIAAIESRRPLVDEVQRNADSIAHALEDVRITLDSLGEQKALIDHVVAELARLEFTVQDARGTLKALQAERDVAQRIAENVRLIHARALRDAKPPA
jgi:chromosome segregation ATPase